MESTQYFIYCQQQLYTMAKKKRVEEWLPVPYEFFDKYFEVSTHGRVRSVDRRQRIYRNGVEYFVQRYSRILSHRNNGQDKHLMVSLGLKIEGISYNKTVYPHWMMAKLWLHNPDPKKFTKVTFIDGDPANLELDNFQWVTQSFLSTRNFERHPHNKDNLKNANIKSGRCHDPDKVKRIKAMIRDGKNYEYIAQECETSIATVYYYLHWTYK